MRKSFIAAMLLLAIAVAHAGPLDGMSSTIGPCGEKPWELQADDVKVHDITNDLIVRVNNGSWWPVPVPALVAAANPTGHAQVWFTKSSRGIYSIRCYLPK